MFISNTKVILSWLFRCSALDPALALALITTRDHVTRDIVTSDCDHVNTGVTGCAPPPYVSIAILQHDLHCSNAQLDPQPI